MQDTMISPDFPDAAALAALRAWYAGASSRQAVARAPETLRSLPLPEPQISDSAGARPGHGGTARSGRAVGADPAAA
ncbi:putative phage integrase fragment (fragment) [Cupriavidus taiwanensis]